MYPNGPMVKDVQRKQMSEPGLKFSDCRPKQFGRGHIEVIVMGWKLREVQGITLRSVD
ncbi:hypothetical protein KIN20_034139 [Parelaphostrongylus tenuis]|uniref:Uncharacterized protein n=1 Tax=Parelaphostrongylus tenuis TaxID=148309 RepID=A0AAD5R9V1_PARTN|nr:hypothetical protein KIN20_034139 [Parelaphostrongylus tenuis]